MFLALARCVEGCTFNKLVLRTVACPLFPVISVPTWQQIRGKIAEWKEAILLAAPKQKRSKRKRMIRFRSFALKNRQDITQCPICDGHQFNDHLCITCYARYKQYVREQTGRLPLAQIR